MMELLKERIGKYPLLFMSAYHPSLSEEENNERFGHLKSYASMAQFGRDNVIGEYEVTLDDGSCASITEKSLCIFGWGGREDDIKEFAIKVGKLFQQEMVLLVEQQSRSASYMIIGEPNTVGLPAGTIVPMGTWSSTTLNEYYAVSGKKDFQLQSITEGWPIPRGFVYSLGSSIFMDNIRTNEHWEQRQREEWERMRNTPPQEISEEEDEKYREWAERVEKKIARGDAEWALMRKFRRGTLKELRRESRECRNL